MTLIRAGIRSLAEHLHTLHVNPEAYRPEQCPACAHGTVWCHGCYTRKSDRQNLGAPCLNPIPILRFICPDCRTTCSVLPEVIPPRRWYLWAVQQAALAILLAGGTCYRASAAQDGHPSRQTIGRWWQRLAERFTSHAATLRPWVPELGRAPSCGEFWRTAFSLGPLSRFMVMLHHDGVTVP